MLTQLFSLLGGAALSSPRKTRTGTAETHRSHPPSPPSQYGGVEDSKFSPTASESRARHLQLVALESQWEKQISHPLPCYFKHTPLTRPPGTVGFCGQDWDSTTYASNVMGQSPTQKLKKPKPDQI